MRLVALMPPPEFLVSLPVPDLLQRLLREIAQDQALEVLVRERCDTARQRLAVRRDIDGIPGTSATRPGTRHIGCAQTLQGVGGSRSAQGYSAALTAAHGLFDHGGHLAFGLAMERLRLSRDA